MTIHAVTAALLVMCELKRARRSISHMLLGNRSAASQGGLAGQVISVREAQGQN